MKQKGRRAGRKQINKRKDTKKGDRNKHPLSPY